MDNASNVFIIGFGKGAAGMTSALLDCLPPTSKSKIRKIILTIPFGTLKDMMKNGRMDLCPEFSQMEIFEAAENNLPDEISISATKQIIDLCKKLKEHDYLIVCCSGGGSACLSMPVNGIPITEKVKFIKFLTSQGIPIDELNIIRSIMSTVKGGKLLECAKNSKFVKTLVLSDIIGSPVHLIASGPTIPAKEFDRIAFEEIYEKYRISSYENDSIRNVLMTSPRRNITYPKNSYEIIGENRIILENISCLARDMNITNVIISDSIQGELSTVAKSYASIIEYCQGNNALNISESTLEKIGIFGLKDKMENIRINKPTLLIFGGEPTVLIKGKGRGGRNQQLCMELRQLGEFRNVQFLSCGTDGQDGPCPVAGAWVDFNEPIKGWKQLGRAF